MRAGAGPNPGCCRVDSAKDGPRQRLEQPANAQRDGPLPACFHARCGCKVRPEMAPRPASRAAPCARASSSASILPPPAIVTVAAMAGLLACFFARPAAAEPPSRSAVLEPGPELTLDQPPPPSARTYTLLGGLATTAGWYGLALGSSYIWPDTVGAKDLRIPVAGPWIAFSHSGCGPVADCHEALVVLRAFVTFFDGIGQAGGVMLIGQGLFLPTREPAARAHTSWKPFRGYAVEMQPTFDAGKNTVGLGVAGVF
jgi:hypothetical protein